MRWERGRDASRLVSREKNERWEKDVRRTCRLRAVIVAAKTGRMKVGSAAVRS